RAALLRRPVRLREHSARGRAVREGATMKNGGTCPRCYPDPCDCMAAAVASGTKPSNPKQSFGDKKVALGLVPDTAIIQQNLAFLEGAMKYGQYNWRVAGVKASTYNRAIRRHLSKWWNGQDRDPHTLVMELASIRACCGILIDAAVSGLLNDDRPPA